MHANRSLCRQAIKLFPTHDCTASKSQRRHLQRNWLKAVTYLGDRWIARRQVERKAA